MLAGGILFHGNVLAKSNNVFKMVDGRSKVSAVGFCNTILFKSCIAMAAGHIVMAFIVQ